MNACLQEPLSEGEWLTYRDELPALRDQIYLNNCSLPPLSTRVAAAGQAFFSSWSKYGAKAWFADDGWLQKIDSVKTKIARLIGADISEIGLAPNVSSALASVVSAFSFTDRPGAVTTELDFPSLVHHLLARNAAGCRCTILRSDDHIAVPLSRFDEAIDTDTAVVATSRVFYASGAIQDVKTLARLAHDRGALLLIDDYQGAGQLPTDVRGMDVDVLIGGTGKWLMGGPGLAYIYAKKELVERLEPTTVGWFGHRRQLDFILDTWQPRETAARFELGTPAMAAVYTADAGLDIVLEAGPERIRNRMTHLIDHLIADLTNRGLKIRSHPDWKMRSSIIMVECAQAEQTIKWLRENNIIVDTRSQCIRVSPYFYNTREELTTFAQQLEVA